MAHTKAQLQKAALLGATLGPELLDIAKAHRDEEAAHLLRVQERQRKEAAVEAVKAIVEAERVSFDAAGLQPFSGSDAQGHLSMRYYDQPALLLNTNAHPTVLVSEALARAERAKAFARVLEQSDLIRGDSDLEAGTYTLARMIEEVVSVLETALAHEGVRQAPITALSAG